MIIWKIGFDPNTYQSADFSSPTSDWIQEYWLHSFVGSPMIADWKAVDVYIDKSTDKIAGDFPALPGFTPPVFNSRALDILLPLIQYDVEILPLNALSEDLYAINVTRVLDCLDKERSRFKYFPGGERVMRVEEHIFYEDHLKGIHMFKIPEQIRGRPYVSDRFKATVEHHGLRGMTFAKVYVG